MNFAVDLSLYCLSRCGTQLDHGRDHLLGRQPPPPAPSYFQDF